MKKMAKSEMKNVTGGTYYCGCCRRSYRTWVAYLWHTYRHYRADGSLCYR